MTNVQTRTVGWGEPVFAVNLQARPTPEACGRLIALQAEIAGLGTELGLGPMRAMPPRHLHLTLFSIVYVRAVYPVDPRALWARIGPSIIAGIGRTVAETCPPRLDFDEIAVQGDAVLVRAPNHPAIERLRDAVEAILAEHHAPVFRATTTHSTIARLHTPSDTGWSRPLRDMIAGGPLAWPIDGLRLVEETVYPGLEEREIERFALTDGEPAVERR
ncbi:MAG: 2'-5' RNA ligase family protein [Alphaproteobacteria bacterium]|nr:2'-5' RNA ligase family protein [Alphaproteobacteria bacterium]